jgi:glycosyltransferase involved in cell wall biosynthesis
MGAMGCRWYVLCGYDSSLLFDFSYVVETPNDVAPLADVGGDLRVVFVGQLIARKRVDLLLHAIAKMRQRRIVLDIVGAGPLDGRLRKLAQDLQIQDVVHFLGGLRNTEVRRVLSTADALVLPSHWDGWGAVINEALCNGARVVCSDFCGAADLVSDPRFGSVFRDGSLGSLTHAMTAVADLGKVSVSERALIRSYSERFSGPAVAEYLLSVVEWALRGSGERPLAPWRRLVGKVG